MDKRHQIGFYYYFDNKWLGGLYYAQNLIYALNSLPDKNKPFINIYCFNKESFDDLKQRTQYPYLGMQIIKISKFKSLFRTLLLPLLPRLASKINLFRVSSEDIIIFPYGWGTDVKKLVYWIPDLQFKHYPQYFSKKELFKKDFAIRTVCKRGIPIVFSSYDSKKDFNRFYPEYSNHKSYVVHFAVNQSDFSNIKIDNLKKKFNISGNYIICPNQFWKHKNHLFLFNAYKKALSMGLNMNLVCTGRLADNRNPEYTNSIRDFIEANDLQDKIKLLGIIDKEELLCLIKNSYAVVQPSLFEGWNTTVEDCKRMNKFIFLSDLPVHREQIQENVCFFDPYNEDDLVKKLLSVIPEESEFDYSKNVEEFANSFFSIINSYTR